MAEKGKKDLSGEELEKIRQFLKERKAKLEDSEVDSATLMEEANKRLKDRKKELERFDHELTDDIAKGIDETILKSQYSYFTSFVRENAQNADSKLTDGKTEAERLQAAGKLIDLKTIFVIGQKFRMGGELTEKDKKDFIYAREQFGLDQKLKDYAKDPVNSFTSDQAASFLNRISEKLEIPKFSVKSKEGASITPELGDLTPQLANFTPKVESKKSVT